MMRSGMSPSLTWRERAQAWAECDEEAHAYTVEL